MKKASIYLFIFTFILSINTFAQKKKVEKIDPNDCLATIGMFYNKVQIPKLFAYLYDGPTIVDSVKLNSNKEFGFILKKNKEYSIKIVAKGYYPRLISFNTKMPDDVSTSPLFLFEFDIILIPVVKGVDDYFTDFPIAIVDWDDKSQKFNYNKKYTATIQKELDKVIDQFKVRQK